jgi:hypothetical protein
MIVASTGTMVDLRRAPIADVRLVDLRAGARDLWADETALWDRMIATWEGLDAAAWRLPGAAPSDAGGPDWSLAEHVGHIADWQELAIDYVAQARATGRWPTDDDYDGGDFDRFNEGRRMPWTTMPATDIVDRLQAARPRLLAEARRFSDGELREDAPWGWVYMTLHGHYLDHLVVIAPWTDALRARQADGDPFVADPRTADLAGFLAQDAVIAARFDRIVRGVAADAWDAAPVTPGWTFRDHIGHLADWAEEGIRAIEMFHQTGRWPADPDEGIDAWNERHVVAGRGSSADETLARYEASHARLVTAIGTLSDAALRSPDGWSWAYDCLHGHTRKHLALLGPWSAASRWP